MINPTISSINLMRLLAPLSMMTMFVMTMQLNNTQAKEKQVKEKQAHEKSVFVIQSTANRETSSYHSQTKLVQAINSVIGSALIFDLHPDGDFADTKEVLQAAELNVVDAVIATSNEIKGSKPTATEAELDEGKLIKVGQWAKTTTLTFTASLAEAKTSKVMALVAPEVRDLGQKSSDDFERSDSASGFAAHLGHHKYKTVSVADIDSLSLLLKNKTYNTLVSKSEHDNEWCFYINKQQWNTLSQIQKAQIKEAIHTFAVNIARSTKEKEDVMQRMILKAGHIRTAKKVKQQDRKQ